MSSGSRQRGVIKFQTPSTKLIRFLFYHEAYEGHEDFINIFLFMFLVIVVVFLKSVRIRVNPWLENRSLIIVCNLGFEYCDFFPDTPLLLYSVTLSSIMMIIRNYRNKFNDKTLNHCAVHGLRSILSTDN